MKKITIKNYVILAIIILVTVVLVFYVRSWYNTSKIYYSQNSVIKDLVSEINENEIGNYTLESQKFVLYASSGTNGNIKVFENNLKKLINKLDIEEDILYLNLDNVNVNLFNESLKNSFVLNQKVSSQISDDSSSTIYVFIDGKISAVLNNVNNYSVKYLESFFEKWGFIDD